MADCARRLPMPSSRPSFTLSSSMLLESSWAQLPRSRLASSSRGPASSSPSAQSCKLHRLSSFAVSHPHPKTKPCPGTHVQVHQALALHAALQRDPRVHAAHASSM